MNYLEDFVVLTGVGVDVFKFFGVGHGARVFKPETGVESEPKNVTPVIPMKTHAKN